MPCRNLIKALKRVKFAYYMCIRVTFWHLCLCSFIENPFVLTTNALITVDRCIHQYIWHLRKAWFHFCNLHHPFLFSTESGGIVLTFSIFTTTFSLFVMLIASNTSLYFPLPNLRTSWKSSWLLGNIFKSKFLMPLKSF